MKLTDLMLTMTLMCTPAFAEVEAIDGDTLELNGTTYRLNGIDAPEFGQKCKGAKGTWPCGKEAAISRFVWVDWFPVMRGTHQMLWCRVRLAGG